MTRKNAKRRESRPAGRFLKVGHDLFAVTIDDRTFWRMLLAVADNDGLVFQGPHDKRFQDYVFKTSGGSTEYPWSNGKWICDGRLYKDRMVPFEFLATTEQAEKIAAYACKHYEQKTIMYYAVSDRVPGLRILEPGGAKCFRKPTSVTARIE